MQIYIIAFRVLIIYMQLKWLNTLIKLNYLYKILKEKHIIIINISTPLFLVNKIT